MKVTVVPAQVTTVEDRIIGNLSMFQVMLLLGPVFGGAVMFGILPPFMEGAGYKYLLLGVLVLVFGVLSIRIKGQVLAVKLVLLLRYYSRPGLYLYSKNTTAYKDLSYLKVESLPLDIGPDEDTKNVRVSLPALELIDRSRVQDMLLSSDSQVSFNTDKKGRLYVRVAEVESKS